MKTTIKSIACVAILAISLTACVEKKKDEPTPDNPTPPGNTEELITTMKLVLRDSTAQTTTIYQYSDLDGAGGNPAIFGGVSQSDSVINIIKNHIYKCDILLLDQSKTPADTISNEVKNEANDHMFFYNNGNNTIQTINPYTVYFPSNMITLKYLDLDGNNIGLGISTLWTSPTTAMAKAPLVIELKHQPSIKNGTYAPGETDIEVSFKIKVNN
jgi:hypothetical protein